MTWNLKGNLKGNQGNKGDKGDTGEVSEESIQEYKLLRKTDPGAPNPDEGTALLEVDIDPTGSISRSVDKTGGWYLRTLTVDNLYGGGGGSSDPLTSPRDYHITAGQSKAWVTDYHTLTTIDSDPRVWEYNLTDGTIAQLPAGGQDHPGWATSRHWARHQMPPGRTAVSVRCGYGETGFSSTSLTGQAGYTTVPNGTWDRVLTADPLNRALELLALLADLRDNSPAGSRIFLHWNQGEQDRTKAQADGIAWYTGKLDDLLTQCKTVAGPMLVGITIGAQTQPTIDASEAGKIINQAHEDTPRRVQGTAFVPPVQDNYRDAGSIHYTAAGVDILGGLNAAAIFRARYNFEGARPSAPQNLRVTRSGSVVIIRWDSPAPRHTAFTVETSTDSGTTWTPVALRHPMALQATATVAAGTPCWVRASATNELATSAYTKEVRA